MPLGIPAPSTVSRRGRDLKAARPPAAPLLPVHGQPPRPPSSILRTLRPAVLSPSVVAGGRPRFSGICGGAPDAAHDASGWRVACLAGFSSRPDIDQATVSRRFFYFRVRPDKTACSVCNRCWRCLWLMYQTRTSTHSANGPRSE